MNIFVDFVLIVTDMIIVIMTAPFIVLRIRIKSFSTFYFSFHL
jgi:hypothetical protein